MNMRRLKLHIVLILCSLIFGLNQQAFAQVLKNTGGKITVESTGGLVVNGNMSVQGDVTDSAIIIIDGEILLKGNLAYDTTGKARFTHGTQGKRAVKFISDSSGVQFLTGNFIAGKDRIYNVVIDRDTGDVVRISTDLEVDGSVVWGNSTVSTTYAGDTFDFNMGGGKIDVQGNEIYISNTDMGAMAGYQTPGTYATDDKSIVTSSGTGGLRREVTKGGTYDYPVSRADRYNPITLEIDNTSTFTTSSDVIIRFEAYQGATVNFNQFLTTSCDSAGRNYIFDCIMPNGVWRIDGSENGRVYYRPFSYPHEENFALCPPPGNGVVEVYRTLRSTDPSGDWTNFVNDTNLLAVDDLCLGLDAFATIDLQGQPIPGGTYKAFSSLGVGSGEDATPNPLPVELLSLDAYPVDNQFIRVDWSTAVEINNAGFTVQRSTDGVNFTDLGWVDGNGNSTATNYYFFDDNNAERGQVYLYRLEQQDFDGTLSYTYMVNAMLDPVVDGLIISDFIPNPAYGASALMVDAPYADEMVLELYNAIGQVVRTFEYDLEEGGNLVDVNVNFLAAGTYYARIKYGDDPQVHERALIVMK